jgi:hypothetical protein
MARRGLGVRIWIGAGTNHAHETGAPAKRRMVHSCDIFDGF